ncbi:glycosyltransferase family protein [Bacteroides mediterraneensis]|uniref:oligosaccharide biosynthesis protein Alg14 n=1 Tax=Bacteroides mediterraneensis TaxID=1841856 RepID=UPI000934C57A|nr:oligosaccharide biosynthesis protein Alg14 [Bacteroides mediterraneensis]
MKKILAVASIGGHWVQLLRIMKGLENKYEISYLSTHEKCATMVPNHTFHKLLEFSRWNWYKLFPAFFHDLKLIRQEKPDVIITTGAAPGLIVLFAAFCLRKKTIWVDSIANVNHLSLCGRVASKFATHTYTQWKELETEKVQFMGNVIG